MQLHSMIDDLDEYCTILSTEVNLGKTQVITVVYEEEQMSTTEKWILIHRLREWLKNMVILESLGRLRWDEGILGENECIQRKVSNVMSFVTIGMNNAVLIIFYIFTYLLIG